MTYYRIGEEIYKISLDYVVASESKKVFLKTSTVIGICQKEIETSY